MDKEPLLRGHSQEGMWEIPEIRPDIWKGGIWECGYRKRKQGKKSPQQPRLLLIFDLLLMPSFGQAYQKPENKKPGEYILSQFTAWGTQQERKWRTDLER